MLVKTEMKTGKSYILTGLFNGRPYNALNDLSIDEKDASTSAIPATWVTSRSNRMVSRCTVSTPMALCTAW